MDYNKLTIEELNIEYEKCHTPMLDPYLNDDMYMYYGTELEFIKKAISNLLDKQNINKGERSMNAQTNNDDFLTLGQEDISTSTGGDFKALEDNLYEASCAGIVVKEMQNYDGTDMEDKIIFIFQIPIADGKFRYLQSKPMKKSLHVKSGMWKLLSDWTKQKDPTTLIEKMGTDGKFDIKFFIGKPIKLMVKSKEVGDKTYNNIDSYMAPVQNQQVLQADNSIPTFMKKDAKNIVIDPSVSFYEKKEETPTQATAVKAEVNSMPPTPPAPQVDAEADLPF